MFSMKWVKTLVLVLALINVGPISVYAGNNDLDSRMENDKFPIHPQDDSTPGALCDAPTAIRYPERIKYCERNVDSNFKRAIIASYDAKYGYRVGSSNRMDFKIDHLIPLCMGGANSEANLWPQHKSVYAITDPLEPVLCGKMSEGKLLQKDAVEMILYAKHHLGEVEDILRRVEDL